MFEVAALYVDPMGPYSRMATEVFDAERDATTYQGPLPVVAHPPCGPWGKLAWRCKHQDPYLGLLAVEQVRTFGGVLEHPVGSRLFKEAGIPLGDLNDPWRPVDEFGGYTWRVRQVDWGHRAEKDTLLYIVGTETLPPMPQQLDPSLFPVERMGKLERRLTPPPLAWWLCAIAAECAGYNRSGGTDGRDL